MSRTYEEVAALLAELQTARPSQSNGEILAEWFEKAPPPSEAHPRGEHHIALYTFRGNQSTLKRFMTWLQATHPGMHIAHVTPDVCNRYIAAMERRYEQGELTSKSTIATEAGHCKRFFEWLRIYKRWFMSGNPWEEPVLALAKRNKNRPDRPDGRSLTLQEIRWQLEVAGIRDFVGILMNAKLGARVNECARVRDDDVFLKERFIALEAVPKRKGPRIVDAPSRLLKLKPRHYFFPIDKELAEVLEWYLDWKKDNLPHPYIWARHGASAGPSTRVSTHTILCAIQRVTKKSQVPVFDWDDPAQAIGTHSYRRFMSNELERNSEGRHPRYLAALRGDNVKAADSAGRYMRFREEELRDYYEENMPVFGASVLLGETRAVEDLDRQIRMR